MLRTDVPGGGSRAHRRRAPLSGASTAGQKQKERPKGPRGFGAASVLSTQHSVLMLILDKLRSDQYVGLAPWVWLQLESSDPPGPFPFIGGVAPDVVASLHQAHSLLLSAVETAISDVFSRRATLGDPRSEEHTSELQSLTNLV